MSTTSRWLNWKPSRPKIIENPYAMEPSKPTKLSSDGFEGAISGKNSIIRGDGCPYRLPEGVRLLRYRPVTPPVAVTVCSVVIRPDAFIRTALAELDARLHRPIQIRGGDSVFELVSKLADCGLELRLEWPPVGEIIEQSPDTEPTKPTKPPPEPDPHPIDSSEADVSSEPISDEELPF